MPLLLILFSLNQNKQETNFSYNFYILDNGGPARDYENDEELRKSTSRDSKFLRIASNWPLRGGKGTHWEGGVRGVAFVHSPLLEPEVIGTENRELLSLVDWLPTLAGHLGGGNIQNLRLDGYNIWDSIRYVFLRCTVSRFQVRTHCLLV